MIDDYMNKCEHIQSVLYLLNMMLTYDVKEEEIALIFVKNLQRIIDIYEQESEIVEDVGDRSEKTMMIQVAKRLSDFLS